MTGLYFFAYAVTYLVFTIVYYKAGGLDCSGNAYIYKVLNWAKPDTAEFYATIVLFGAVPVVNLLFWFVVHNCFPGKWRYDDNGNHVGGKVVPAGDAEEGAVTA